MNFLTAPLPAATAAILLAAWAPAPLRAAVTSFTDRAAFLAAAGAPNLSEDFNGFTDDLVFAGTSTAAPAGFSLTSNADAGGSRPVIDAGPFQVAGLLNNGTPYVYGFTEGDRSTPITLGLIPDAAATALGADVTVFAGGTGPDETLFMAAYDLAGSLVASIAIDEVQSPRFFGFVATDGDQLGEIRLVPGVNGDPNFGTAFGFDDVVGVVVPEPATAALALGTLALLAGRRRIARR